MKLNKTPGPLMYVDVFFKDVSKVNVVLAKKFFKMLTIFGNLVFEKNFETTS